MLTRRQSIILQKLYEHMDAYLTAEQLAAFLSVSANTVKRDLLAMKSELSDADAQLVSKTSKGYKLIINNTEKFQCYLEQILQDPTHGRFNEQAQRVYFIMTRLIESSDYIRSTDLADQLFISDSCLVSDMKIARRIFGKYDIQIVSKPRKGLYLTGDENNIRQCMIKENIGPVGFLPYLADDHDENTLANIRTIVTDVLIESHFVISDIVFQNLIIHIATSVLRMKHGHYISDQQIRLDESYNHALVVANDIMQQVCTLFTIPYSESEARFLALNIQGKREISSENYISDELNRFIYDTLVMVKDQFNVNLTEDTDFRISLALHTYPLITRMESNMQIKNAMTYEIKQKFILAFDAASVFSNELYKKYGVRITDDEISYLALHFEGAIQAQKRERSQKVLIISPQKKSFTILLRQRLTDWFKNEISTIDIVNPSKADKAVKNTYDILLATEEHVAVKYRAICINFFPTDQDYQKISLAMNGYQNLSDILNKFHRSTFVVVESISKKGALQLLCEKAKDAFGIDDSLYEQVSKHEQVINSYFGDNLAVPHPEELCTDLTFVAVLISKKPIDWDSGKHVRLVLLVSIAKNNKKAYNLWGYLSMLISDQKSVEKIIRTPTYENMIKVLSDIFQSVLTR